MTSDRLDEVLHASDRTRGSRIVSGGAPVIRERPLGPAAATPPRDEVTGLAAAAPHRAASAGRHRAVGG